MGDKDKDAAAKAASEQAAKDAAAAQALKDAEAKALNEQAAKDEAAAKLLKDAEDAANAAEAKAAAEKAAKDTEAVKEPEHKVITVVTLVGQMVNPLTGQVIDTGDQVKIVDPDGWIVAQIEAKKLMEI